MNNNLKQLVAKEVIKYIPENSVLGIGTGSTVNCFIDILSTIKHKISAVVSSSQITTNRIKSIGIPLVDLNNIDDLPVYIDGADEINNNLQMTKGGGGALTGEKIIAAVAKKFICIADESKKVNILGNFPLPVEVIPMARSYVARQLVKLGGFPMYRQGVVTDYGNVILDVYNLNILDPEKLEQTINNITGVVSNGLFAIRSADVLLLSTISSGIITKEV